MNLYALSPDLTNKLQGFSKRYGLGLTLLKSVDKLTDLIILGDGTPDDWVVTLISHKLNGSKTVGIVKPQGKTGTSTFDLLHDYYILKNPSLTKVVFFVDGEEKNSKDIYTEMEASFKKHHIAANFVDAQNDDRFRVYDCSIPNRQFKVALVINGVKNLCSPTHKIEDHLILTTAEMKLLSLPEKIGDPKPYWRYNMPDNIKDSVFKEIIEHRRFIDTMFPQQLSGCTFLKTE